ncbi:MAG: multiheme c-type cytochrome [Phototrophicales bacterium]|nr:multiheme c-type cytochrome [Phototrophicales bacterium]
MKKHFFAIFFSFLGCTLVLTGILLLGETSPIPLLAQVEDAEYEGARACSECHSNVARIHTNTNHALTLQDVGRDKESILANFDDDNLPQITFPDSTDARPLSPDDIAYTLGAGRYVQRYLYAVARNDYQILPVEWNTITNTWQSFLLDGTGDWLSDTYDFSENCAYCHTSGFDTERLRWEDDGVQCESCHGLGSVHVEEADDAGRNPSDRELTRIKEAIHIGTDAQVCGQCHSMGESPDGHTFPTSFVAGGTLISDDSYALVSNDDPLFWWGTNNAKHTNMQFNEWAISGHAEADVTCVACHSPHAETETPQLHLLTQAPYALCASCHNNSASTDDTNPNAPPNVEMYEGLTVIDEVVGIPSAHFSATDNAPDCLTCHMPNLPVNDGFTRPSHTFAVIMPQSALAVPEITDGCSECHQDQATSQDMQALIDDIQATTQNRIEAIRPLITDSTPTWIVTALRFVEDDGSFGVHNYTYADALLDTIETALGMSQP